MDHIPNMNTNRYEIYYRIKNQELVIYFVYYNFLDEIQLKFYIQWRWGTKMFLKGYLFKKYLFEACI